MCHTRPNATIESLKLVYLAIRKDDPAALESAIKNASINVDQSIAVYDDNYEPVNQCVMFNKKRSVTTKKPVEIAAAMGHARCVKWLLANGADITPLMEYSASLYNADSRFNPEATDSSRYRFIDEKTNYMNTAGVMMEALDRLNPDQLEKLCDIVGIQSPDKEDTSNANRPAPKS